MADIYVCNNWCLITKYYKKLIKVGRFIANSFPAVREIIQIWPKLEDGSKEMILNLQNVYCFLSSLCNLMSFKLLNNNKIYYNNRNKTLYQLKSNRVLAQARRWKNSYFFKLLNFSNIALFLTKINDKIYIWPSHAFLNLLLSQTFLLLITWHKRLGHTNFSILKVYQKKLKVGYIDVLESYVYNTCHQAKATKIYNKKPQKRF